MKHAYRFFLIFLFGLTLVLGFNQPLQAQTQPSNQKVPITHEMVWLMKRVGAPNPSPDGKWVVFSVVEPSYDDKERVSDLWIVPADGSIAPRRLTFSKGSESGAVWSPDSTRLAFTAKREGDEVNQVYVMDVVNGGEAVRVTSLSTGASSPKWRPDGKALLFVSSVFPGALDDEANKKIAAERKAQKYKVRVYESYPIRYWDRWLDDTQAHVLVQTLEPGAKAKDLLAGTKLVAEPGFSGQLNEGGEDLDAIWTPDGQSIIFVATTTQNTAAYAEYNFHLFQISASGGEPVQLTQGTKETYSRPQFRPDGKALYFGVTQVNEKIYNLDRLAMLPWPVSGQPTIITSKFDRSVGSFGVTPDNKTIYLLAEEAGHEKLFSIPSSGGEVTLVFDLSLGAYNNLAIPQNSKTPLLFANWESAVNPSEIVRIDPVAKRHQALTSFNVERASTIDWQPLRHFWFTSKAGKRIHSMMVLPPKFDEHKKYPLVVFMHGGPAQMWRDQFVLRWNYHLLAQPGYVVLLTNYTGSPGYGEKFAQDIQGDPLAGPGNEINEAADEAIRQFPFIDETRQAAGGASYGGHLANWLQATTTRYKCLFSHAGSINQESQWGTSDSNYHRELSFGGPVWEQGKIWREQNPARYAKNFRTPILISVGENDFRVPLNQSLENWSYMQRMRVPSKLLVFPEENHWILRGENARFYLQELHAWLKHYLEMDLKS